MANLIGPRQLYTLPWEVDELNDEIDWEELDKAAQK
jgi:hypothetical protein